MTFLQGNSLVQMRRQRLESLRETCTLRTQTEVTDNNGGWTQAWTTTASVACAVTTSSSTSPRTGGVIAYGAEARSWIVALAHDRSVKPADRITWSGRTLEVVSVDAPGGYGIQTTAYCTEVD
jgi:head-tail adaptor